MYTVLLETCHIIAGIKRIHYSIPDVLETLFRCRQHQQYDILSTPLFSISPRFEHKTLSVDTAKKPVCISTYACIHLKHRPPKQYA